MSAELKTDRPIGTNRKVTGVFSRAIRGYGIQTGIVTWWDGPQKGQSALSAAKRLATPAG